MAGVFSAWPPFVLQKISPKSHIQIVVTKEEGEPGLRLSEGGQLILDGAGSLSDRRRELFILLADLRSNLERHTERTPLRTVTRSSRFPIPPDFALAAKTLVRQFASHGLTYHPSGIFRADLGLVESVTDTGKSTHKVRLRTTNPAFNRWVYNLVVDPIVPIDPGLEFYAGAFGTVATNPFAIVGIFAWGADAEITDLLGNRIFLDGNIQHRVRSSGELPTDKLVFELNPRLETRDGRASVGLNVAVAALHSPEIDVAFVAQVVFD